MKTGMETQDRQAPASGPRVAGFTIVAAVLALLGALFLAGYWPRLSRSRQLAAPAQGGQRSLPVAIVVPVREAPKEVTIRLPGNIQAEMETPLFARADGYIKRRLADIGDRVRAGQLLAEIDSPELEQQIRETGASLQRSKAALKQAEAVLAQARANLALAEATAQRWETLVRKGVVSRQDGDEKQAAWKARAADAAAAEANVQAARDNIAAAEAALQRLLELQAFRQVRAPFAGVITARNIDVGTLVSAGSGAAVRELYRLAQIGMLRVFVNVPQSEAPFIRPGLACTIEVEEYRGRRFAGRVTRTASALDPAARTLLTEVQTPNPESILLPGMYATVNFRVRRPNPPLLIPAAAYRNTDQGPVVAVLGEGATVHIVSVRLGRDYGAQIEVLEGLEAGQKVITNPNDEIREGTRVRPVAPPKPVGTKQGGMAK